MLRRGRRRGREPHYQKNRMQSGGNGALQKGLRSGVAEQAAMTGVMLAMLQGQSSRLRIHRHAQQCQQNQRPDAPRQRASVLVLPKGHQEYYCVLCGSDVTTLRRRDPVSLSSRLYSPANRAEPGRASAAMPPSRSAALRCDRMASPIRPRRPGSVPRPTGARPPAGM
jgi:hypothetical protein